MLLVIIGAMNKMTKIRIINGVIKMLENNGEEIIMLVGEKLIMTNRIMVQDGDSQFKISSTFGIDIF